MNEIVGDVSTNKDELIKKHGAVSLTATNNNNNKKENLFYDNNIRKTNSASMENLRSAVAEKESVTASSGFSTSIDQDAGLVGVESLSHISSLGCFEVESSTYADDGGGVKEVESQQHQDSSPWDIDTSEKVYLSVIRDTRAPGNNIPDSSRIFTGKCVEDGISKEIYSTYAPNIGVNNTTSRGRNNQGVVGNASLNASVGQGFTGGISISNAMQFGGVEQQQDALDIRIDSALLSALNDQKERMGLLRLEQVLLEFMNDRSIMFMDVGGPNNSTVLKEGTNTQSRGYQGEENNRGRQTSFQRLCLHRLADRFNIVREALPSPNCDDYYMGGSVTPSLIRLVKMKDSMIPSKLLIDLDLSSLDDKQHELRDADGSSASLSKNALTELTDSFSASSLNTSGGVGTNAGDMVLVGQKQEKPRRKMKIMKRRSGDGTGNNNDGKDKKNSNKNKGKKLSEKEKAYAEARARIFNELEEKRRAEGLTANASSGSPPPAALNKDVASPPSPSSAKSDKSSNMDAGSDPNSNLVYDVDPDYSDQQPPNKNSASNVTSKVTWRNRRQEENDPDFRRGNVNRSVSQQSSASTMMSQGVPYVTPHGVFVSPPVQSAGGNYMHPQTVLNTDHPTSYKQPTAAYPQQQMYYPPQVNSSNPYVQQPYYPQTQQQQYYPQSSSSNSNQSARSTRQPYHQTLYSSNANNSTDATRKESIVYSMEEFPPIG